MSQLRERYLELGATLAPDGIPLHFGDLLGEYQAALDAAVLLDRSHEGRIEIAGKDRFDLLSRISTNDTLGMAADEGRPTIFTNANARILDRLVIFNRESHLLGSAGPGRGQWMVNYLQKNIFFGDDVQVNLINARTYQFALHGPLAGQILATFDPTLAEQTLYQGQTVEIAGASVYVMRLKPFVEDRRVLVMPLEAARAMFDALLDAGEPYGLKSSGGLTYNTLRIRAGRPGMGTELSGEHIPLEVGLWDEISFNKGCYTGQEIIARMESRERIARTIVRLKPAQPLNAPVELLHEGKKAGRVTSCVQAPDGDIYAIGVVKTNAAEPGATFTTADEITVTMQDFLETQPPFLVET
jgi:tRNA-modifying protein YgfZ